MSVLCRLCGRMETEPFLTRREKTLYHRCFSCGYVQIDEKHILSEEEERRRYLLHENSSENSGYVRWLESFLNFAFDEVPPAGTAVLDFGSGPEPVMAELMRNRGCKVLLEDCCFAPGKPDGPFRLITAVEVFEHLLYPAKIMESLASRLSPGGRLCLSTEFLPETPDDFESWHYRNDPTHIGFFTEKSLIAAGRENGLEKMKCDGLRYIAFAKTPC